jgi:hypothetical protein
VIQVQVMMLLRAGKKQCCCCCCCCTGVVGAGAPYAAGGTSLVLDAAAGPLKVLLCSLQPAGALSGSQSSAFLINALKPPSLS